MKNVNDIRQLFAKKYSNKEFVSTNREASMNALVGSRTIELIGESFIADEDAIFGALNKDYIEREEAWYNSKSLNVNDIPGATPAIWKAVADKNGFINSNYGWCIYSPENVFDTANWENIPAHAWIPLNGKIIPIETPTTNDNRELNQYNLVIEELLKNPESRRAMMIYTRPSMWLEYNKNGRSDFMCTNTVQYLIRDNKVNSIVQMRSNDGFSGFRNDAAWQKHVLSKVTEELNKNDNKYETGNLYWQVGSLHFYERDFYLIDHYNNTGEISITKAEYNKIYNKG